MTIDEMTNLAKMLKFKDLKKKKQKRGVGKKPINSNLMGIKV